LNGWQSHVVFVTYGQIFSVLRAHRHYLSEHYSGRVGPTLANRSYQNIYIVRRDALHRDHMVKAHLTIEEIPPKSPSFGLRLLLRLVALMQTLRALQACLHTITISRVLNRVSPCLDCGRWML
jgi:hypothetical protein